MSTFALTDPQRELLDETHRLGAEVFASVARHGQPGRVNRELVRALGDQGVLPRLFPTAPGGTQPGQVSAMDLCLIREALAATCTEAENAVALQGLGCYPILQAGRDDVVERWVPAVARGEAVAAFALTEPDAGSDAASLQLAAERDGDGYRLTGEKLWISNAPDADVYVVFARTTPAAGARGVTAFVVEGAAEGLTGEALELLAPHPIGRLTFDGVFVPEARMLGEVDAGFRVAMRTLDRFRPSVGANAVGMAQAALDAAIAHADRREAFDRPLRQFQAVSHRLADASTKIEAARLLVYAAATAFDAGVGRVTKEAAMAKLYATEVAQEVVDVAVQVHGAAALQRGHLLEHLYREVRAPRIYEGTSEIQREIIARELYRHP